MGNSKTDIKVKVYKNSECVKCFLSFVGVLKVKSVNGKDVVICEKCFREVIKNETIKK